MFNFKARTKGFLFLMAGLLLPITVLLYIFTFSVSDDILHSLLGESLTTTIRTYLVGLYLSVIVQLLSRYSAVIV